MKTFNTNQAAGKVVKTNDETDLDVWSLPSIERVVDDADIKTNALGRKPTWRYEPPEEIEEEIKPLTAQEIESIRKAAQEEGFNQGKEEGFTAGFDEGQKSGHAEGIIQGNEEGMATGLEQGQQTITELTEQWTTLVQQLHQPLSVVENNVEQQLLHLVVQLTEAITLQEAKINPDIIIAAIAKGMKLLPSRDIQTQILLHPEDIQLVQEKFTEQHIQEQGWRLLPAPQLAKGSCQIENSTSNIDLSIKSRIKEVLESFLQEALHQ
jgi:flagellar assembly protein FliH